MISNGVRPVGPQAMQEYVPATIFCASDHLNALLCKNNYIRMSQGNDRYSPAPFHYCAGSAGSRLCYSAGGC